MNLNHPSAALVASGAVEAGPHQSAVGAHPSRGYLSVEPRGPQAGWGVPLLVAWGFLRVQAGLYIHVSQCTGTQRPSITTGQGVSEMVSRPRSLVHLPSMAEQFSVLWISKIQRKS